MVSIVIATRNEEDHIGKCLDSIIQNGMLAEELEILVVDGMSTDKTRDVVTEYGLQYPFVRLLENPKRIAAAAWNIGARAAHSDLVMILSAHSGIGDEYISRCVEGLRKHNVDNIGGIVLPLPRTTSVMSRATTLFYAHPFGVGKSDYRFNTNEVKLVDTVYGGCYKKEVFDQIGYFNEELARSVDNEFNYRLIKHGGKILMDPEIVSCYYPRSTLKDLVKASFRNGEWLFLPLLFSNTIPFRIRHLVPMAFVSAVIGSSIGALRVPMLGRLRSLVLLTYLLANVGSALQIGFQKRELAASIVLPIVFLSSHVAYGVGSLWGLGELVAGKLRVARKQEAN
jgi:glycosyltransferase involved in cell wall biosynthesis